MGFCLCLLDMGITRQRMLDGVGSYRQANKHIFSEGLILCITKLRGMGVSPRLGHVIWTASPMF